MKNQNFVSVLLFLILPIASCSSGADIRIKDFPVTNKISGVVVEMSKPYMFVEMALADSLLIFSPVFQDNEQIHVFDKKSFKLLKTAGIVGRGPGEVINPGLSYVCESTMMLWLTDMGRRSLLGFSLKDIINNDLTAFNTVVPLPESVFVIARFQSHQNNLFSYADASRPEYLLSFFNKENALHDSISVPDKLNLYRTEDVPGDKRMLEFNYTYSYNRNGDRIAVVYKYSDVLTILDRRGNILRKVTGPDFLEQKPGESEKEIITYNCLYTDDKYIYAVYRNQPRFDEETNSIPQFATTIHVFDWTGEPVARLLSDHTISSFVVDWEEGRIVTFCPATGGFVWYEIPDMLK